MDSSLLDLSNFLLKCYENKIAYLKTYPEILDISDKNLSFDLELYYSNKKFKINVNKSNFSLVFCLMKMTIFKNKYKIICYNFKNYCSAYKFFTKKDIEIESSIFDIKVISSILGQKLKSSPDNFKESYLILKNLLENKYEKIKNLYQNIHVPLILKVIPCLENNGLIHTKDKKIKKSYYEVEAQENSRLSTYCHFKDCFLPMNLKKEDKEDLIPINQEDFFVYFDYKNMEVSILENLTKDPELSRILNNYNDFYEGLYKEIINTENFDKNKRKKIKAIFLPFIYGASPKLISEKNNIKLESIEKIVADIKKIFRKTFNWLEDYSNNSEDQYYENKFGKIRRIEKKYKSINFIVQSTSSIFCLDKLIDIHNILEGKYLNFYIHDGYGFVINNKELKSKVNIIKNILLEENKNFKNMYLNVSCTYGRNLNNMLEYKFEEEYEKNMQ